MASLDFIRDIAENLEKQSVDYVLVTVQKSKVEGEFLINNFDSIKNKEAVLKALENKLEEISNRPEKKRGKNG